MQNLVNKLCLQRTQRLTRVWSLAFSCLSKQFLLIQPDEIFHSSFFGIVKQSSAKPAGRTKSKSYMIILLIEHINVLDIYWIGSNYFLSKWVRRRDFDSTNCISDFEIIKNNMSKSYENLCYLNIISLVFFSQDELCDK